MASYSATPKGLVRGAVIDIEETVKQRPLSDLAEQERATVQEDAQAIINALGGQAMIEPEQKSLEEALSTINAILDVADHQQRPLDTLERDVVIDAAGSILLLFQASAGPGNQ
jgi:hypothetical protein